MFHRRIGTDRPKTYLLGAEAESLYMEAMPRPETRFKLWKHPRTGEIRIYVEDREYLPFGERVYFSREGMAQGRCALISSYRVGKAHETGPVLLKHLEQAFPDKDFTLWKDVLDLAE